MAKAIKLFDIMKNCNDLFKLPVTEAFACLGVMNRGEPTEYYIDPRTYRNEENIYVVKPITWNEAYFAYVCPYCQEIHIEAVNYIGEQRNYEPEYALKKGEAFCRCRHLRKLKLKFIVDMSFEHQWWNKSNLEASERLKLHDDILSFVNSFEKRKCVDEDIINSQS